MQEDKEWSDLKSDLESKVAGAQMLNDSLQSELDRVRSDQANVERDLRSQLDHAKKKCAGDTQWKRRFDDLDKEHSNLKVELREQRQVTEEVRQEASTFLKEMKAMSEHSGSNWEREEKLTREVHRLEEEVKEWKSRYARTKTQLRNMRASSLGLSIHRPDAGRTAKDNEFTQPDGLVKDVHITKFQISIDELLRVARSGEPSAVLDHMKSVVVTVRHITQDIDAAKSSEDEVTQLQSKLKSRVSATANNLITASKNFASSNGISPVSLLDAAASHLAAAVVELVRTVKIRPTPAGELEDDDDGSLPPVQSPGYFSVTHSQTRTSGGDSVYSGFSSPPSMGTKSQTKESITTRRPISRNGLPNGKGLGTGVKLGFGMRAQDSDLEELKVSSQTSFQPNCKSNRIQLYLEDQTEGLVHSIQSLVASIRAEEDMKNIRNHINAIASVVGKVVSSTENYMNQLGNPALGDRAEPIVRTLADCRTKLLNAGVDGESIRDPDRLRDFTNKLPPLAFEIARETKELVQRIDQIEFEGDEDDFR